MSTLAEQIVDVRHAWGEFLHALSDWLHLRAHRAIGDPDWRARNG